VTQNNRQPPLIPEPPALTNAPVGHQADITYYERVARTVLNPPESTGMPYWSVNPYVGCAFGCAYCYARYAHRYVREREADDAPRDESGDMPSWLAFERRIYVKRSAPDLVARSLAQARRGRRTRVARLLRGEPLVVGTATDPYQPAERHFRITRGVLEALAEERGLRVVLITKSALVTRDVNVLTRLASRSRFTVHLSLITLDRELARRIEPRAPTPEARLRALARLRESGIDVGINLMPILPGITDRPNDLAALVNRVAGVGATHINAGALRLQSEAKRRYLPFIEAEFPELAARYRSTFGHRSDVGERYRAGLRSVMQKLCDRAGIRYRRCDEGRADHPAAVPRDDQLELKIGDGTGRDTTGRDRTGRN
jgi:DNA repair photolyase